MDILQRAKEKLADTEAALKRMIGEAAASGEYSTVETLVRWASSIGSMCSPNGDRAEQADQIAADFQAGTMAGLSATRRVSSVKRGHSKRRRSYPVFAKSGDVLVKIAWSKKSKSEYQHKSPQPVIRKLAESLARHAKNGSIVSMEKILPLKADDGTQFPDYQVYVGLAWLRHIGAVKQNGRQGYSTKRTNDVIPKINAAWSDLPEATAD